MPIQKSTKGEAITTAQFENPFEFRMTRFGTKGLNVSDAIDKLEPDELSRMLNVTHRSDQSITGRPGQTAILSGLGTNVHSVRRLNNPRQGSYIHVVGVDGNLKADGTTHDSGYSGDPLTMVPYQPPLSGDTWMFIADRNRMQKMRADGLTLPIGLPAPPDAASCALDTEQKTVVADLDTDGTAVWTANPGFTYDDPPVAIPTVAAIPFGTGQGDGLDQQSIAFQIDPGVTTPTGYYSFFGVQKAIDMSEVGSVPASDSDYIHVYLNFSDTAHIDEVRLYFVCSPTFSPAVLPGVSGTSTDPTTTGANSDAYVKSFSANDFAAFIQAQETQTDAAETARIQALRTTSLTDQAVNSTRTDATNLATIASQDPSRQIALQASPASDQWQRFGVIGNPLTRGDFQRIGTAEGRDWSTITGIVVYISTSGTTTSQVGAVEVRMSHIYMTGGSGPDSGLAVDSPYDYLYTHYDTLTGAEGNPSPVMDSSNFIDSARRTILVTPDAYGYAHTVQRFYRRGGSLPTDWFFVGQNGSDGGVFADTVDDTDAAAANTVQTDNDRPVSTVDQNGNTVVNQPISAIWGPIQDMLMGCGDPYRPGHVYFCKPGQPDSWPASSHTEVCSPSEELMNGCTYGGQAFVFSKERLFILYPNLSGDIAAVTATVGQCTRGMINRWALAVGNGGMYFVNRDGIYRTVGGPEDWLSKKIDPLFRGLSVNGLSPIDFTQLNAIRLSIHENELYFQYQDTLGIRRALILNLIYNFWREYTFVNGTSTMFTDEGNPISTMVMGGATTGKVYSLTGTTDDGSAIACQVRTGSVDFDRPREEKRMGDMAMELDPRGIVVTVQNFANMETLTGPAQTIAGSLTGPVRTVLDAFGTTPQIVTTLATDITWSASTAAPILYWLGASIIVEPEITINRVTQWDDLGSPDEVYLTGVTFDCDTNNVARHIIIETDFGGATVVASTVTVTANGRRKVKFSWPAVQANKVRLRPNDDCLAWILYKVDWIYVQEPPRIAGWDTYFENGWDQYYTGVDLYCDTFNLPKTVEVYVDEVLVTTATVTTNGRKVFHITIPWGRGHVFHLRATDTNPGILYDIRWQLVPEPSEQTNWNQNFTVEGIESDKFLKAIVFQCDTFGLDKTVTVECDGVVVETLTVNTNGRKVVELAFPQHLGRVFRIYPTDNNPGRLYTLWWVFDQEPLALTRWETQEITHGLNGWHYPIFSHVTLKSNDIVTLTVTAYNQTGVATTSVYTIPSTAGVKTKTFLPFNAGKGVLYKYLFTCPTAFWLYREETAVSVREWGTDNTTIYKPFGNDGIDQTRQMTKASLAAARTGGGVW